MPRNNSTQRKQARAAAAEAREEIDSRHREQQADRPIWERTHGAYDVAGRTRAEWEGHVRARTQPHDTGFDAFLRWEREFLARALD